MSSFSAGETRRMAEHGRRWTAQLTEPPDHSASACKAAHAAPPAAQTKQVQALLGDAVEQLHRWLSGELGMKHPPSLQVCSSCCRGPTEASREWVAH